MQRPGQDPAAKDDVSWWMKYAGRGLGTVGSLSTFSTAIHIIVHQVFDYRKIHVLLAFFSFREFLAFRRIYVVANAYKKQLRRHAMLKCRAHSSLLIFRCL